MRNVMIENNTPLNDEIIKHFVSDCMESNKYRASTPIGDLHLSTTSNGYRVDLERKNYGSLD